MFLFSILLKNYSIFDIGLQKFFLLSGFQIEIWFRFGLHLFSKFGWDRVFDFQKNPKVYWIWVFAYEDFFLAGGSRRQSFAAPSCLYNQNGLLVSFHFFFINLFYLIAFFEVCSFFMSFKPW